MVAGAGLGAGSADAEAIGHNATANADTTAPRNHCFVTMYPPEKCGSAIGADRTHPAEENSATHVEKREFCEIESGRDFYRNSWSRRSPLLRSAGRRS
ncbi:hypothetical protein A2J03_08730 [Rhodococcus sp. EPR-157]|nr:hypothetical protein A2J03_08730 [Rhodococcus sp. EPR-157]